MKTLFLTKSREFGILMIGMLCCYALLSIRLKVTGSFFLLFMAWNLFLAGIPYGITLLLLWKLQLQKPLPLIILGGIWLLFLPNAPYVVSDLQHALHSRGLRQVYDTVLISTFAIVSLFFMSFSIKDMLAILKPKRRFLALFTIFMLCGFGIYLGRYLRWNSWDIIQNPDVLFEDIVARITHPFQYKRTWSITLVYSCISMLAYMTITWLTKVRHYVKK